MRFCNPSARELLPAPEGQHRTASHTIQREALPKRFSSSVRLTRAHLKPGRLDQFPQDRLLGQPQPSLGTDSGRKHLRRAAALVLAVRGRALSTVHFLPSPPRLQVARRLLVGVVERDHLNVLALEITPNLVQEHGVTFYVHDVEQFLADSRELSAMNL